MASLDLRLLQVLLRVLLIAARHLEDAAVVGLTIALVLASKPHRKDATMCQRQAAGPDFIGMLLPAPAVRVAHLHLQQEALCQRRPQAEAHVHQAITGCLIAAVGVCLTAQAQAVQAARVDPHQHLLLHSLLLLRLKHQLSQLLHQPHLPQPNQVPLLLQQANPYPRPQIPNL